MAGNPRAGENGKATRFNGKTAAKAGKKGAKKSAEAKRKRKETLDVFRGAREHTTQEELMEAYETIKRFAKRGSLPHWQEMLRLTGQMEQQDTEIRVVFDSDMDDLAR